MQLVCLLRFEMLASMPSMGVAGVGEAGEGRLLRWRESGQARLWSPGERGDVREARTGGGRALLEGSARATS